MEPLQIGKVEAQEQIQLVAGLAKEIWREHYAAILSGKQIEYMIETFQSAAAIRNQINREGYEYFMLCCGKEPAGYMAIQPGEDKLFLSKLYLRKEYRGKKLARQALMFLEKRCEADGMKGIWLTVNRNNETSIKAYQKLGFQTVRTQVADIGNGFVMDDYIMEKVMD